MIRDIVGADPALTEAAWESMQNIAGILPATGTDGDQQAGRTSKYFEF